MAGVRDRVAVVTGAANGLGREIARVLAREGARVALGDLDAAGVEHVAAEINQSVAAGSPPGGHSAPMAGPGGAAFAMAGDLTEEGPAARLIEAAVARFGKLDILVNNVGGSRNAKIWEMRAEDWDFVLRLNLRSTFLCTRAAAPHMMRQRYGRIVCMSSGAREGTPWTAYYQGGAAYSASKAGVHGFVRDVALELAEHGVNVNAVAPGPIDTERAGPSLKKLDETVEFSPSRMTPLHRIGEPIEVAHAVLFLCSDEASYITGHTLAVAGGR
jgi:NAD(P)-dependent dehydrogenase (short-subunit alcohol dehydrogenase family)